MEYLLKPCDYGDLSKAVAELPAWRSTSTSLAGALSLERNKLGAGSLEGRPMIRWFREFFFDPPPSFVGKRQRLDLVGFKHGRHPIVSRRLAGEEFAGFA